MSIVISLAISVTLLSMLYVTCNDKTFECSWTKLPMISDVIALDTYDQIFTFLTSLFMLCIMQGNIRAFY